MNTDDGQKLVEAILDSASKHKSFDKINENLWRQGYLIGLLAQLASDDTYVKHDLEARLKRLDPHRR